MLKIAFLTFVLSLGMIPRFGYSQDEVVKTKHAEQNLVDLGGDDQVRELERRVAELERETRFQDDRIRSLERTVNDVRRAQR